MLPNNDFKINISNLGVDSHFDFSEQLEKQSPAIKQKILSLSKGIYLNLPDEEKKVVTHIRFTVIGDDQLEIKLGKGPDEIEYDQTQLDEENTVRRSELIRQIKNLANEILSGVAPLNKSGHPDGPEPLINRAQFPTIENKEKTNSIIRIFRSIKKWYLDSYKLKPRIEHFSDALFFNFATLSEGQIKWQKNEVKIENFINNLFKQVNEGYTSQNLLFTKEEINDQVQESLENRFLKRYEFLTGNSLSSNELRLLKIEMKIQNAASKFENIIEDKPEEETLQSSNEIKEKIKNLQELIDKHKTTQIEIKAVITNNLSPVDVLDQKKAELEEVENELKTAELELEKAQQDLVRRDQLIQDRSVEMQDAQKNWHQVFDGLDVLDIPLKHLASMPINAYTEDSLITTWQKIFLELIEQGMLNDLADSQIDLEKAFKQTHYGDVFLLANQLLPQQFKEVLSPILNSVSLDKIDHFVWDSPLNLLDLKSLPSEVNLQNQQLIYQRLVKPLIDKELDDLLSQHNNYNFMAEILKDSQSDYLIEWAEKAIENLELEGLRIKERNDLGITNEHLIDRMILGIEELGLNSYHISGDQISNLRKARQDLTEKRNNEKLASNILSQFEEKLDDFEVKMQSLNTELENERQISIQLEVEIPTLETTTHKLERNAFQIYVGEQKSKIEKVQTAISELPPSKSNRSVLNRLSQELDQLQQDYTKLEQALADWDNREKILPLPVLVTIPNSKRNILDLTDNEINTIKANIESTKQKIDNLKEKIKYSNNPTYKNDLQKLKTTLTQLEIVLQAISENKIKVLDRDRAIERIEKERKSLLENFTEFTLEHFTNIPVTNISMQQLQDLPITDNNEPVMKIIWESLLSELKDQSQLNLYSDLQFKKACQILSQIQAPESFKLSMSQYIENLTKGPQSTLKFSQFVDEFNEKIISYNEQIQEAKSLLPPEKITIPALEIPWKEAGPNRLKLFLKSKKRELKANKLGIQEKQQELNDTQTKIDSLKKARKPKNRYKNLETQVKEIKSQIDDEIVIGSKIEKDIERIKDLLDGKDVIIEPTDIIEFPAQEGVLSELSDSDWQNFERKLEVLTLQKNNLEKIENQEVSLLDQRLSEIKSLFDLRKQVLEQQVVIEKLEEQKKRFIETKHAEMQELCHLIDSASLRTHQLAKLNINEDNEKLIIEMWKTLLSQTFLTGKLDHLDQVAEDQLSEAEKYAFQFLTLKQAINSIDHPSLKTIIQDFENDHQILTDDQNQTDLDSRLKEFINSVNEKRFENYALNEPSGIELMLGKIEIPEAPVVLEKSEDPTSIESKKFNTYEIENLKLLTKALKRANLNQKLNSDEQNHISSFIVYATKNDTASKKLNEKLGLVLESRKPSMKEQIMEFVFHIYPKSERPFTKIPYGISEEAVELIRNLSYNFKTPRIYAPLIDRFERFFEKVQGNNVKPADQFTYREMGILQKCVRIGFDKYGDSLLEKLEKLGVLDRVPMFKELQTLSKKAHELFKKAQNIYSSQIDYQDGDIVANVGRLKLELAGRSPTFEEHLHFKIITPYCHGAKIYKDDGKLRQSHVTQGYTQDDFTINEGIYSEVWRLNVASLVPKDHRILFQKCFGPQWEKIIQEKYQLLENHIEKNENHQFDNLENQWETRIQAGKADYMWRGHIANSERNFERIANRMLGENDANEEQMKTMICSEFVSRTTLAVLIRLDKRLSEEIGEWLILQGKKDEGEKLKAERNCLIIPYDKRERFKRIHPGRMLKTLIKYNCVKFLDRPPLLKQLLRR